ncbi:MAG TPA: type II secretion system protein [Chthoniobacterales bacterium]
MCNRRSGMSGTGRLRLNGGFTLLEVCVVLFIVAMIFVVSAVPAGHLVKEEKLFSQMRHLQSTAKTARLRAMAQHEIILIEFNPSGYELRAAKEAAHGPDTYYTLPRSTELLVRTPADDNFRSASRLQWYFGPNGLCEPIAFLLQEGKSWVRFRVDPLTARVEDEQSFVE